MKTKFEDPIETEENPDEMLKKIYNKLGINKKNFNNNNNNNLNLNLNKKRNRVTNISIQTNLIEENSYKEIVSNWIFKINPNIENIEKELHLSNDISFNFPEINNNNNFYDDNFFLNDPILKFLREKLKKL